MRRSIECRFPLRVSIAAVQAALIALATTQAARAAEPLDAQVRELVQRASTFEVGIGWLSDGAYKANEFTGLKSDGAFLVGNFDLRRGGDYGSDDASRFRLTGTDVGTESRDVLAELTLQGRTRFYVDYDQLLRNRSDSYQTPLLGAGTSVLTLPSNWLVPVVPRLSGTTPNARGLSPAVTSSNGLVAGVPTAPTAAQLATAAAIQGKDLPSFHTVDLYTKRTKYTMGAVVALDRQLEFSGSYQHEHKVGLKPMSVDTAVTGGDIGATLPDLIDQNTDQLDLGATYHTGGLSLEGRYYTSVYTDLVHGLTWYNWALPTSTQTTSTPPSNHFQQYKLTAAYSFTPTTRLVADASWARSTQNEPFLTPYYAAIVPRSSANALVLTKVGDLKFTSHPVKDLGVTAAYKFEDRDNRTPVSTYGYFDVGASPSGTSPFASYYPTIKTGSNLNLNANRPFSKRAHKFDLDLDYHLTEGQSLRAGIESQNTTRYCSGSWISCEDAAHVKEHSGLLEWRGDFLDSIDARVGAEHGRRTVDYNENAFLALVPYANVSPTGAPGGSTAYGTLLSTGLNGYGPLLGLNPPAPAGSAEAFFFPLNNVLNNTLYSHRNRISELPGLRRFDMADRVRDKLRTSVDWHATEQFTVQAGIDYNRDNYDKSVYGLLNGRSLAANLDASYAFSDTANVGGFFTHEDLRNKSAGNTYTANSAATSVNGATAVVGGCFSTFQALSSNYKIDPCLNWTSDMRDKVDTFGATLQQKNLLGGKLEVNGTLAVSRAHSTNDVRGGNYVNNPLAVAGAPAGTVAAYYIAATPLPLVKTDTIDLQLNGLYAVTKAAGVRLGYRYQHMISSDWSYDGLQYGGLNTVLPTNERAPNYSVHTFVVSYVYTFL